MQDTVFIEGLQIDALIGVHDWERQSPRPLVFDLQLAFDNRVPASSDALVDTLDYEAIIGAWPISRRAPASIWWRHCRALRRTGGWRF